MLTLTLTLTPKPKPKPKPKHNPDPKPKPNPNPNPNPELPPCKLQEHARDTLRDLDPKLIAELKSYNAPPDSVHRVCVGVYCVLGRLTLTQTLTLTLIPNPQP